ncbi:MAG: OmpH family outer membrane protein [Spirochaetes bacterium]|uniref:OmpH family outer membrane protein n=1 Tax=Candidatus Avitreponema avistercoris TaxID=2840705 RepID=A0A9D9HD65_9SPIR|nr:OmpH family outer membrane protein [Candidatus Avitreponema avistercoris]
MWFGVRTEGRTVPTGPSCFPSIWSIIDGAAHPGRLFPPVRRSTGGNVRQQAKLFLIFGFLFLAAQGIFAQQITRFAVIDTARIYTTFYRDSRNVRDFESKRLRYQREIQRLSDEIKDLRQQKVDAEALGETARVTRLEAQISSKTNFLLDYSKAKNEELDELRKELTTDDEFYSMLYEQIRKISEADGYSMVLSLQEGNSIIWYSPTVDITDKVIRSMISG